MKEKTKKRILVIDDEEEIRILVKFRLENNGYEVLEAEDGHKGIKIAREQKPDLILLDVMMPDINGYQVCWYIKSVENLKVPIIMLTALSGKEYTDQSKSLGADDFIAKPYHSSELLEKIKKLMKK